MSSLNAQLWFMSILAISQSPVVAQKQEYRLVWSDEFDKSGSPDSTKWNYEKGFVRNEELQWYQPENAVCKKGLLIIEARREEKLNPVYVEGNNDWRRKRQNIQYTS